MRLTRVKIANYKGIETIDFPVGKAGAMIVGRSKSGKTSILDGIRAALAGEGIDPSCIRNGEDRSEILVDMDHASVRCVLRRSGNNELKTDGLGIGKPRSKLDDLFGRLLDPLELARMKGPARQKMVREAMPGTVAAEHFTRWTGETWEPEPGEHWTEAIARVRQVYYGRRTTANKDVETARAAHARAEAEAARLASDDHKGVLVPLPGEEDAPVRAAEQAREALTQRQQAAEAMATRTAGTRTRIGELEKEADAIRAAGPMVPPLKDVENANARFNLADSKVQELERQLAAAQVEREQAKKAVLALETQQRDANECAKREAQKRQQVRELCDSLAEAAIQPPTAEEIAQADAAVGQARAHRELVLAARAAHDALVTHAALGDELAAAKREAQKLDEIVGRLTTEAPAEIAAQSSAIPGLTFTDDDIALDGKVFTNLCGTETIELCTEIARRMNPKGKLIRVNGLEQLDPVALEAFVKMATRDGWQLLGTRVEAGELQIVALEPDEEARTP